MDFQAFLSLVRRQLLTVAIISISVVLAATALFFLQPPAEKLTLLFSVGISEEVEGERNFDATKTADDFAKTVAGWMRSPTIAERVSGISGTSVALSAAPQAKQNFLVEAVYSSEGSQDNVSQATKQVLGEEIEKYNSHSKFKFLTSLHGESVTSANSSLVKTIPAALVGGILLALAWIALSSYWGGRVNSVHEAEKILKTKAAVVFSHPRKDEVGFLKKLVKRSSHPVLIGADFGAAKLREKLNLGVKVLEIPKEAEKLGQNETKIVVVKLDKTKANTLRMLHALFEEKIKLVIWS